MESLGELERLVATVVRVVKTGRTGKRVGTSCSRIDTDNLDVFSPAVAGPGGCFRRKERFLVSSICARQAWNHGSFLGK
jgi:hypothetical protein